MEQILTRNAVAPSRFSRAVNIKNRLFKQYIVAQEPFPEQKLPQITDALRAIDQEGGDRFQVLVAISNKAIEERKNEKAP